MQTTAINGHPSNATKSQRIPYIAWYGDVPLFWVPFSAIPAFLGIIFLVQFDFFRNNPDFWVLSLIFYFK